MHQPASWLQLTSLARHHRRHVAATGRASTDRLLTYVLMCEISLSIKKYTTNRMLLVLACCQLTGNAASIILHHVMSCSCMDIQPCIEESLKAPCRNYNPVLKSWIYTSVPACSSTAMPSKSSAVLSIRLSATSAISAKDSGGYEQDAIEYCSLSVSDTEDARLSG